MPARQILLMGVGGKVFKSLFGQIFVHDGGATLDPNIIIHVKEQEVRTTSLSSFDRSCYVSPPRRASNANHCVVTFLAPTRHNTKYSKTMSTKYSETKDTKYSQTRGTKYSKTTDAKYSETISIDAELIFPF